MLKVSGQCREYTGLIVPYFYAKTEERGFSEREVRKEVFVCEDSKDNFVRKKGGVIYEFLEKTVKMKKRTETDTVS